MAKKKQISPKHLIRPFKEHKQFSTISLFFFVFLALRVFSCVFLSPPPPPPPPPPTPGPTPTATATPTHDERGENIKALWTAVYGNAPTAIPAPPRGIDTMERILDTFEETQNKLLKTPTPIPSPVQLERE